MSNLLIDMAGNAYQQVLDGDTDARHQALVDLIASTAESDPGTANLAKAYIEYRRGLGVDFVSQFDNYNRVLLTSGTPTFDRVPFDPSSNVKIGVTTPSIPPESISIEEVKGSTEIHSLRNPQSYQIKTGRGMITISMVVKFPTKKLVNTELYEILAQLRASPILTIESDYIADAVYGSYAGEQEAYTKRAAKVRAHISRIQNLINTDRNTISALLTEHGFFTGVDGEGIADLTIDELEDLVRRRLGEADYKNISTGKIAAATTAAELIKKIRNLQDDILIVAKEHHSESRDYPRYSYAISTIPVFLQSLSLAPIGVEGLALTLNLLVFNHFPYTPRLLYRTLNGSPTPDIGKCPLWLWYSYNRARTDGMVPYDPEGSIILRYPLLDDTADILALVASSDALSSVVGKSVPTNILEFSGKIYCGPDPDRPDEKPITVIGIACGLSNRLALQPVLSGQYPSIQYMGSIPGEVVFEFEVPNSRVAEFHKMKRAIDAVNLHPAGRKARHGRVRLEGSGTPCALLGFKEFQILSINTRSSGPESTVIELRLSVFQVADADRLLFDADKSGVVDTRRLKEKLLRLFALSKSYRDKIPIYENLVRIHGERDTPIPNPKKTMEYQAHKLLYGEQEGERSLITLDLLLDIVDEDEEFYKELLRVYKDSSLFVPLGSNKTVFGTTKIPYRTLFVKAALTNWRQAAVIPADDVVKQIVDRIVNDERYPEQNLLLLVLDVAGDPNVTELALDLERVVTRSEKASDLYPDLHLPTYGALLGGSAKAFLQTLASKPSFAGIVDEFDLKALPSDVLIRVRELTGAPTHRELGHSDVEDTENSILAVTMDDFVDPDFYFFKHSAATILDRGEDAAIKQLGRLAAGIRGNPIFDNLQSLTAASATGRQLIEGRLRTGVYEETSKSRPKSPDSRFNPATGNVSREATKVKHYGNAVQIALETPNDPKAPERVLSTFRKHIRSVKDDYYRMSRAFPTFKLYFIEEDDERLLLLDDWYGFNAVSEAEVTRHKWEPDVAVIDLINIYGTLDESGFQKTGAREEADYRNPKHREFPNQEPHPTTIERFPIQEGTRIVLKFGYSSNETELETVFTGKVVEINRGDIISIVAQGYGAELTMPVDEPEIDLNGWWSKFFKNLLGIPIRHNILALVAGILSSQPAEHLGAWGVKHFSTALKNRVAKNTGFEQPTGLFSIGLDRPIIRALLVDPRLENVFSKLASEGRLESKLLRSYATNTTNDEDLQSEWMVQGKTGLQLLRELNFHHPDFVFSIIPYDGRATLFFGRPDDEYSYTEKYRRGQLQNYSIEKAGVDKVRAIARDVGQVLGSEANPLFRLVNQFKASSYFERYTQYVTDLDQDTEDAHILKVQDILAADRIQPRLSDIFRTEPLIHAILAELFFTFTEITSSERQGSAIMDSRASARLQNKALAENYLGISTPGIKLAGIKVFKDGEHRAWFERAVALEPGGNGEWSLFWREVLEQVETEYVFEPGRLLSFGVAKELLYTAPNAALEALAAPQYARSRALIRRALILFIEFLVDLGRSRFPALVRDLIANSFESPSINRLGKKPFRAYHFVDSVHNILQNNIVATRAELSNIVYVRCKNDSIRMAMVDNDLYPGELCPGYRHAPNAETERQQMMAAYAHLADGLRPMYRGELILRGNERIKPHDVVWLLDLYNGMWGPVEVERVIHHFSYETGFTTTVVPHLHCEVANDVSWAETTGWNIALGLIGLGIATAGTVVGTAAFGIKGGLLGAATAAPLASDLVQLESGGEGMFSCLMGNGSFGRKENPVMMHPLMVNGLPLYAGMRGYNPGNAWFFNLTSKQFEQWSRGAKRLWDVGRFTATTFSNL